MKTFKSISLTGAVAFTGVIWIGCYNQKVNQKSILTIDRSEFTSYPKPATDKLENSSKYKNHILLNEKDLR